MLPYEDISHFSSETRSDTFATLRNVLGGWLPDGSGQNYDVFVSYAHADNEMPLGTVAEYDWVTTLARNLNTGPNHYRKNLFIDHRLMPGDLFSDDLVTTVEKPILMSE